MKQLKLFFALFAMLALGVGNVWAEKITDYAKLVSGQKYYIGASIGSTDYYFSCDNSKVATGVKGIAQTDKSKATIVTAIGSGTSWAFKFENNYYLSLKNAKDNGKVVVSSSEVNWTLKNNNQLINMKVNGYCLMRNNQTTTTNFGSYASGQKDVWFELIPSGETPETVTISLNKTELSLQAGATETLTATVTGSTESVTWSSSATGVATVDNNGKVTAVAAGEATITAAIGDVKATCAVKVTAATTPEEPGTGGETTTVTYVFKDDSNCPGNDKTWFSGTIDEYTGWTATKGTNDPKYYTTGTGLRIYNGGKFTITSSKVMLSITLTFSSGSYTFSADNTNNPQTVTPNAKSYEWSVSRTCRLQKIEITYAADAGSSGETVVSLIPKNELF